MRMNHRSQTILWGPSLRGGLPRNRRPVSPGSAAWPLPAALTAWLALLVLLVPLTGCVTGGSRAYQTAWLHNVRAAGLDPDEIPNPLETTEEMETALHQWVESGDPRDQLADIQRFLFDNEKFPFVYDARGTYTASETFRRREGNCVSFTNLFIALGRSLGIPLQPALILRGDVEKEGDLVVINTHLIALYAHGDGITLYDFAEQRDDEIRGLTLLDDLWLTAIFLNNRGVDALRAENYEQAIRQLRQATILAPEFTAAYGNLGVAHRKAGEPEKALEVYQRALEIESRSPTILNNLASLYRSTGREAEARAALEAADLSKASPYLLITRGDLALAQGDPRKALKYYKRARRTNPDIPGPWLAIARLELRRNNLEAAQRALQRALELAPESSEIQQMGQNVERLIQKNPPSSSR
jgi:tetratricopeptide (TPR) repeat protein